MKRVCNDQCDYCGEVSRESFYTLSQKFLLKFGVLKDVKWRHVTENFFLIVKWQYILFGPIRALKGRHDF